MNRNPLWRARTESLTHLRRHKKEQAELLDDLFVLIDQCLETEAHNAILAQRAKIEKILRTLRRQFNLRPIESSAKQASAKTNRCVARSSQEIA
jgi:hypothetical protein